jgi:transposase
LLGSSAHFDTTSLTVYGDYESTPIDIRENNVDTDPLFTITHGHSKAHRPDLKQMILNLATTGSGFPIWMEAHSGNASDKKI